MISSQEPIDHNCDSSPFEHNPRLIGPSHQISPIKSHDIATFPFETQQYSQNSIFLGILREV
jgi:hypothetical protein